MGCGASSAKNVAGDPKGEKKPKEKKKKEPKEKKKEKPAKEKKVKKKKEEKPTEIKVDEKEKKKKELEDEKKRIEEEEKKRLEEEKKKKEKEEEEKRKLKEEEEKKAKEKQEEEERRKREVEEEEERKRREKEEEEEKKRKLEAEEEERKKRDEMRRKREERKRKKLEEKKRKEEEEKRLREKAEEEGRYLPPKIPTSNPFQKPKANFDLEKLEDFIFQFPYFNNIPCLKNIYLLDYDDRNSKKDLIFQDSKIKEGLSGKHLSREDYGFLYDVNTTSVLSIEEEKEYFKDVKQFVVFPLHTSSKNQLFRLIVCTLFVDESTEDGKSFDFEKLKKRILESDKEYLGYILPQYSRTYLLSDLRSKFHVISSQLVQWIHHKTGKDSIHVGFFHHEERSEEDEDSDSELEEEEETEGEGSIEEYFNNVLWTSGIPENPIYDDGEENIGEVVGRLLNEDVRTVEGKKFVPCVVEKKFRIWLIDPKIKVGGEKFLGLVKIYCEEMTKDIDDVIHYSIRSFSKTLRMIKNEEEGVEKEVKKIEEEEEEKEEEKEEDDDDGGRSSQEEREESADEFVGKKKEEEEEEEEEKEIGVFFKTIISKSLRKIRQLKRAELAELISFKNPPKGVHEVVKSVLYLLGVSRKSVKDWERCRKILKTKSRGRFKVLQELDINSVTPIIRKRVKKSIKMMTSVEAMEINKPVGLLYSFLEVSVASWAAKSKKKDLGVFEELNHNLQLIFPKKGKKKKE